MLGLDSGVHLYCKYKARRSKYLVSSVNSSTCLKRTVLIEIHGKHHLFFFIVDEVYADGASILALTSYYYPGRHITPTR